jgi:hypothetical protein
MQFPPRLLTLLSGCWIEGAKSLRKSRWNGEERGSAFLPLWLSDSPDRVEWPKGDALDAIDRRQLTGLLCDRSAEWAMRLQYSPDRCDLDRESGHITGAGRL